MPVQKASNPSGSNCSYRGVEYRLLPGTQRKAHLLSGLCGACRFVWNTFLDQINRDYKDEHKDNPELTWPSLSRRYTSFRPTISWLNQYSSNIVRNTLKHQAEAWQAFFKGLRDHPTSALLSILIFDNKTFIAYYCVILHFTMQKMQVQQTILATLRSDLPTLSELVTSNQDKSRQALGKLICSKFKLLNTKGRPRISGCMKALYVLEEEGHVSLPKPQTASFVRGPRLLEKSVPAPVDVPADVRQIQDLEILLVTGSQARAIWNTLLAREHPKGTTTFAGAQVRYLIRSTWVRWAFPPRHCI